MDGSCELITLGVNIEETKKTIRKRRESSNSERTSNEKERDRTSRTTCVSYRNFPHKIFSNSSCVHSNF